MTVGAGEGRRAHAPLAVDRSGEEGDAALLEERARGIDVVDPDAELEPEPVARAATGAGSTCSRT
jgi:hypothetical protein